MDIECQMVVQQVTSRRGNGLGLAEGTEIVLEQTTPQWWNSNQIRLYCRDPKEASTLEPGQVVTVTVKPTESK